MASTKAGNKTGAKIEGGNPTFDRDLQLLLRKKSRFLEQLAKVVVSDKGIGIDETNRPAVEKVCGEHDVTTDEAMSVVSVSAFLVQQAIEEEMQLDELLLALHQYCEEEGIKGFTSHKRALQTLLGVPEAYRDAFRAMSMVTGGMRTITGMEGLVELRAAIDTESVLGYVPVLTVQIQHQLRKGSGKDQLVLHLTERKLDGLIRLLQKYRKQFDLVAANVEKRIKYLKSDIY